MGYTKSNGMDIRDFKSEMGFRYTHGKGTNFTKAKFQELGYSW